MGRVVLHSGGISAGRVRLNPRGASDVRRPVDAALGMPQRRGRAKSSPACASCGTRSGVAEDGLVFRCLPCRKDTRLVAKVERELKARGLPGLTTVVAPGTPSSKARRQALAARQNLRARKRKQAAAAKAKPVTPERRTYPVTTRRTSAAKKAAPQSTPRRQTAPKGLDVLSGVLVRAPKPAKGAPAKGGGAKTQTPRSATTAGRRGQSPQKGT